MKHLSWSKSKVNIYIFSEQTFFDMYTEIKVDISYFNQDTKQNIVLRVKMQKNHKVFSQLLAALTLV